VAAFLKGVFHRYSNVEDTIILIKHTRATFSKKYLGPNCITAIILLLRRTLVHFNVLQHSAHNITKCYPLNNYSHTATA